MSCRHGTANRSRRGQHSRRKGEDRPLTSPDDGGGNRPQRRARPVFRRRHQREGRAGIPEREERKAGLEDGNVRGLEGAGGRLAPGRRADLHSRRQTASEIGHGNFGSLQESAGGVVQSRVGFTRSKCARDPDPAGRRHLAADAGESAGNEFPDRAGEDGFSLRNLLRQSEPGSV